MLLKQSSSIMLIGAIAVFAANTQPVYSNEKTLSDPTTFVLQKLDDYDLVMIGEQHWIKEEPAFINDLIKRCYEKDAIDFLFLEFGEFAYQKNVESFLQANEYDPQPIVEMLKNMTEIGWGYQEYFDIFKTVYEENKVKPENERVRIILVDGPPSTFYMNMDSFYDCFESSPLSISEKWQKVTWLREGIAGRDPFMAEVIAMHLFNKSGQKGIYYAGSSHIRKDLQSKDYGLRVISTGGILSRKYPGRVFTLTFHKGEQDWQTPSDFYYFEKLYKQYPDGFGIVSSDTRIRHFMLESDISTKGISLEEALDGYIMLNRYKDYNQCSLIPGFYDDEFAKVVWNRLRKKGMLNRLPAELGEYKTRPWNGDELADLINRGLH